MDKALLRKEALRKRCDYDLKNISINVVDSIIKSGILDKYNNIGIYYPIGSEIDITNLLDYYKDKNFYLPKTDKDISFIKYNKNDLLIDGPFHTKEPIGDIVLRDNIECFIIPCVAISKDNKRIGYGKGYYDRYLSNYNGFKIGICYKEYGNCDISLDSYDIVLDYKFLG